MPTESPSVVRVPTTENGGRIHALDGVRAAAMLLGISLHASVSFLMAPPPVRWPALDTHRSMGFDLFLGLVHMFRMPLFFVVAGFFGRLLYQRMGAHGFIQHRLKRVLLPFVVGLVTLVPLVELAYFHGASVAGRLPPGQTTWTALTEFVVSGAILRDFSSYHLWFLYYLMMFYACALVGLPLARRLLSETTLQRLDGAMRRVMKKAGWRPLVLSVPTVLVLLPMVSGTMDTPVTLMPMPRVLVAYGLFFSFGWMLQRQPELLPELKRGAWTSVLLAMFVLLPAFIALHSSIPPAGEAWLSWQKLAAMSVHALIIWLMILGGMGLALRYLDRPSPVIRYVADASYWLYLIHVPIIMYLQVVMAPLDLPALVKFALIHLVALPPMVASYHWLVKDTLIGEVLNGTRSRRASEGSPAPAGLRV